MPTLNPGDRVNLPDSVHTVTVEAVGRCPDLDCEHGVDMFQFTDPETGDTVWEHGSAVDKAFDVVAFQAAATQLRAFAAGYADLGLDAAEAARWANRGFTPNEARPWLAEGFDALDASGWANRYIGPAEARERANRGEQAHPNGMHEGHPIGEEN